jgi:hypothetical protein
MGQLRTAYRKVATSEAVGKCGYTRVAENVRLDTRGDEAFFVGVACCHKVWECPVCAMRVRGARAKELAHVIKWHRARWGQESVAMLTLTVRHAMGDDLRVLQRGLADAWRRFTGGRGWQSIKEEIGLEGHVRAIEPTVGPHGWHPHFHVLLLTHGLLPETFRRDVHARWADAVDRALGHEHTPTMDGVFITQDPKADYPLKLGIRLTCELISTGSKEARSAPDGALRRTPLQLLADWVQRGDEDALLLYWRYVEGMAGARMLTWSPGLRKRAQLAEITDELILEGEPGLPDEPPRVRCAMIVGAEWDRLRLIPGADTVLKEIAVDYGTSGVYYAIDVLLANVDPEDLGPRLRPKDPDQMDILLLLPRRRGAYGHVV